MNSGTFLYFLFNDSICIIHIYTFFCSVSFHRSVPTTIDPLVILPEDKLSKLRQQQL